MATGEALSGLGWLLATVLMATILASIATLTAQWLPNWNRGFERVHFCGALSRLTRSILLAGKSRATP